jgi:hypothetical protein
LATKKKSVRWIGGPYYSPPWCVGLLPEPFKYGSSNQSFENWNVSLALKWRLVQRFTPHIEDVAEDFGFGNAISAVAHSC